MAESGKGKAMDALKPDEGDDQDGIWTDLEGYSISVQHRVSIWKRCQYSFWKDRWIQGQRLFRKEKSIQGQGYGKPGRLLNVGFSKIWTAYSYQPQGEGPHFLTRYTTTSSF
ncbi:hypothetical protein ACJX0J_031071, partial [Zea mays]